MIRCVALLAAALLTAGCDAKGDEHARPRVGVSDWRWDVDAKSPGFCLGGGYVRNESLEAVADIRLEISFYDAANIALSTGRVGTDKRLLQPGEQSSFQFSLPCPEGSESAELKATHGLDAPLAVTMRR